MSENTNTQNDKINVNRLSKKDQAKLEEFKATYLETKKDAVKQAGLALTFAIVVWKFAGCAAHILEANKGVTGSKLPEDVVKSLTWVKDFGFNTVKRHGMKKLVQDVIAEQKGQQVQEAKESEVVAQLETSVVGEGM